MHDVADLIALLARNAQESVCPCDVVCGCVEEVEPLTVSIAGGRVRLVRRASEPTHQKNDTVLLLRLHGGQRFLILDKAVDV